MMFVFNDTAATEIYTLSLHDALPISAWRPGARVPTRSAQPMQSAATTVAERIAASGDIPSRTNASSPRVTSSWGRSEEHTSELQSRQYIVCRLLLEIKKALALKEYLT